MNRRGSRDANHATLQQRFEDLGCSVVDLSLAGVPDLPDVAVGCMGITRLVEFKNPETGYGRAGMTAGQKRFAERWRGGPIACVSTPEEVTDLVVSWRKRA